MRDLLRFADQRLESIAYAGEWVLVTIIYLSVSIAWGYL